MDALQKERLKTVYARVTAALEEVVRDLRVTEEELHLAGRFFNRLGASGFFPSMLDVALSVPSLEASRSDLRGPRANVEGPFYRAGAPVRRDGSILEHQPGPTAESCVVEGRVTDAVTGQGIAGAELDFWQADEDGQYDNVGWHLRGVIVADAAGNYSLKTVVPNDYPQHQFDPVGELLSAMDLPVYRAAHIHLKVRVGGQERLTTQFFMPDSAYLDKDYVRGAVVPELIVQKAAVHGPGRRASKIRFDIALPVALLTVA
ncbi:MAG TPA: hypothetical protein VGA38_01565 [Candidatus Limnocylindria bacterium]